MSTLMREYPRIESGVPVEYTTSDDTLRGRAINLGGGGMLLDPSRQIPGNLPQSVHFRPARHMAPIQAQVIVRHDLPGLGVGLEFVEIAPADRARILQLILFRRGSERQNPRARVVIQVEHAGGMFLGFSRALSADGMFVETKVTHAEPCVWPHQVAIGAGSQPVLDANSIC